MSSAGCTARARAPCPPTSPSTAGRPTGRCNRPVSRLGITTGVKLGNAVKRNRARRRIRELYRTNEHRLLPGYDVVVVARARVIYGRYPELERSFLQLMRKLGICPPREARP